MKKLIFLSIVALIIFEGVSWWLYRQSLSKEKVMTVQQSRESSSLPPAKNFSAKAPNDSAPENSSDDFPPPIVEQVNGKTERTIHMGVRQWAWDPSIITAKQGERVRLIIHNADVPHAIVIPDLNVEADIPPEGAIVEFDAIKKGAFDFLCATYCGTGHAAMQGTIVIE